MSPTPYHPGPAPQQGPGWVAPPPPRKSRTGLYVLVALAGVVLCLFGALIIGHLSNGQVRHNPARVTATTTAAGKPPAKTPTKTPTKAAKATKAQLPTRVDEGTFRVGKDVAPGEYKTTGADGPLCYWHTAKDSSDDRIIDQGVTNGETEAGYVRLKDGQYFKTSGCNTWVRQ